MVEANAVERYRSLADREKRYLAQFIRGLVPIARDISHPMRALARKQISMTMWRWTADAFDTAKGLVVQDAYKYNVAIHPTTDAAVLAHSNGAANLRHEHIVPRSFLTDAILRDDMSEDAILQFLQMFCHAAIVTASEDKLEIRPRNSMPSGWICDQGDILARYSETLRLQLKVWSSSPRCRNMHWAHHPCFSGL